MMSARPPPYITLLIHDQWGSPDPCLRGADEADRDHPRAVRQTYGSPRVHAQPGLDGDRSSG